MLRKFGNLVLSPSLKLVLRRRLFRLIPDSRLSEFQRFVRDGHNYLLLGVIKAQASPTILDFGGYKGHVIAQILKARPDSQIHTFEPIAEYSTYLSERYALDRRVVVHPYGLGETFETRFFFMSAEKSGLHASGRPTEVQFRPIQLEFDSLSSSIDIGIMNIEGGEYELIPLLGSHGLLRRFGVLFVQFHRTGESYVDEAERCREILRRSHQLAWSYDFVWEMWTREH